jgi:hypothetical protein
MRHANKPSGPGKPVTGQRGAAETREQLEEMSDEPRAEGTPEGRDPTRGPRTAERDFHTKSGGRNAPSDSGRRRGRAR